MFERRNEERLGRMVYIIAPATISTMEELQYYDQVALGGIADLEQTIESLKAYRLMLADRAAVLASAPFHRVLTITRRINYYSNKKTYTVSILHRFSDPSIEDQTERAETFPGTERHKAFALFRQLQKENPGSATEDHTAKQPGER